MRGRSLKLQEAHKANGSGSICSILWGGDDHLFVTSATSDTFICIREQSQPLNPIEDLCHHKNGGTALALNPSSNSLAFGSIDHSVKLYIFTAKTCTSEDNNIIIKDSTNTQGKRFSVPIKLQTTHRYHQVVNANVNYDAREGRSSIEVDEEFTGQPLKGKVACTKFMRICTDGKHSVVLCKPASGRTHEIRVHLQYTGHSIANDALYLSKVVASRSTFGTGADRAASVGMDMPPSPPPDSVDNGHCTDVANVHSGDEFSIDPTCSNCPDLAPKGYDGDEEGLWLHCVRYTGPDWSYECPYPGWAFLN